MMGKTKDGRIAYMHGHGREITQFEVLLYQVCS